MFGKLIGAIAGAKASDHVSGMSGTGGALLGAAVPMLVRRLSLPGMIAVAAGGYLLKRYKDKQDAQAKPVRRRRATPKVKPSAT